MNYRDTLITCQQCEKQFIFTVEKQRQMSKRGLEIETPELCDDCIQRTKYGGKLHGRIKWFSPEKGWGFVIQDDGSEIFVHRDGLLPTQEGTSPRLDEGLEVLYDVLETSRGPQAVQVVPYSG
jgi:CspA family cold shock protein